MSHAPAVAAPVATPAATLRHPWALAIGGSLGMAAANGVDRFIYTPILPVMAQALQLTASQAGLIASANYLGYLLGALLAARPGLPGARRQWLLAALAISALCTAGMALTSWLSVLLLLRLASGIAGAVAVVMAIALVIERLATAGRSDLAPLHFAGVGVGIVASALIVAWLQAAALDWRAMWLCAGATSLCCLAVIAASIDRGVDPMRAGRAGTAAPLGARFGLLVAANTLSAFGYVITATFIVALVRGSPQLRDLETSIWAVFGLAAAPSVALWMALARRHNVFRTFAVVCGVEAIGVVASVLWLAPAGTIVAALCVGGSFMGTTALGMLGARALTSGDSRRPVALMTAGFGGGQVVGPALAGVLRDATGSFLWPSLCAAASLLVAAVLALRAGAAPAGRLDALP
ncbi:MAG TPA: YbfB/YjiJ family MFS transporter [Burkholderiaceae bacterium]|nr:YbfB/YjiJ family MFS transporter [Burkholderiaceae bacterium]